MAHASPFRRAFRRLAPLPCAVVREHDFRLVGDLALDLSTRGMLVRATEKVLTGEEVVVSFEMPGSLVKPIGDARWEERSARSTDSTNSTEWFDALATVARVVHGRRPGDRGVCLGLEFYGLKPEVERALFEHLRGIGGTEPCRPLRKLVAA